MPSPRETILFEGARLTSTDRNKEYGEPYENLSDIALLWTAYLEMKTKARVVATTGGPKLIGNYELTAEDVAWLNVLQKIARTCKGQPKRDTYIDAATYAAIAGECAEEEEPDEL